MGKRPARNAQHKFQKKFSGNSRPPKVYARVSAMPDIHQWFVSLLFSSSCSSRNESGNQQLNRFHESTKEDEIGITEYVTTSAGFTGIIKQR